VTVAHIQHSETKGIHMAYARGDREARERVLTQMRNMLNTAKKANRGFTNEERLQYDAMHEDVERHDARIEKIESRNAGQPAISEFAMDARSTRDVRDFYRVRPADIDDSPEAKAFTNYLRVGLNGLDDSDAHEMRRRYVANINAGALQGVRNAQSSSGTQGGYIIPTGFSGMLEVAKKWFGGIANGFVGHFKTETGNPFPWPTIDDVNNTGRIIGQNVQVTETDLTFGQITFNAYIFSSDLVLVPLALMEDSYFNISALVADLLGTRLGRLYNQQCTIGLGTGSSAPTGIVTAVVAAGNVLTLPTGETASIAYNDLVNLEHSVDPAYRFNPTTAWMFSDAVLKLLKKLVDGNGRPLWQPGLTASFQEGAAVNLEATKPTILGHPYLVNSGGSAVVDRARLRRRD
jgi:HK97 family phage major capsid protein